MSNSTSRSTAHAPNRLGVTLSETLPQRAADGIRAVAFWGAVLLPLAYVPVAYVDAGGAWLLTLFVLHVACIVGGHEHGREHDAENRSVQSSTDT